MNDAYRTPGRAVDETEVECTKIREAAETKRKQIEEKEKTKRERYSDIGLWRHVITAIPISIAAIAAGVVANSYLENHAEKPCREEVRKKTWGAEFRCTHPRHLLVDSAEDWTCKCGTPKLEGK